MNTSSQNSSKANLILSGVFTLLAICLIFFIIEGLKTGELRTKVVQPVQNQLSALVKKIETVMKENKTSFTQSTSSSVIINNETVVNGSVKSSVKIIRNGKVIEVTENSQDLSVTKTPTLSK